MQAYALKTPANSRHRGRNRTCRRGGSLKGYPAPVDDAARLDAWRGGDKSAGKALFDAHAPALARFFRNKVDADVDDLIQQTFETCLRATSRFEGRSTVRTYLIGVARNVLLNHLRRRVGERIRVDFEHTSVVDLAPRPSSVMARRTEREILLQALRSIPLELQVILELYYWEAMSAREIGEALEQPEGTVRTKIRRAKHSVAERIEDLAAGNERLRQTATSLDDWAASIRDSWRATGS